MNGILDDTPVGVLDPRSMALMQMGMGLLATSGPSATPTSFGQNLGRAGMQGMQAFQQQQQTNQQQQLFAMKMAEARQAEVEKQRRAAAMARLSQDPRFAGMEHLLEVAPQQAIERAYPKESVKVVAPGGALVNEKGEPIFQAPNRPEVSPIARMIAERDALPQGHPNRAVYDEAIKKQTTPTAPVVTVDNRQESEFNRSVGKEMGEQYSSLLKADMNAPSAIAKYQRLGSLLGQVNTGKFKGTTTELKAAAKSMGFDLNTLGVGDDVAPAQAARALSNQLALELRNPAGGAGMPGALSDKDREFLVQSLPTLESDPGAVGKMIDYRVKLAQREQKVAKMARDYRRKNGKFDEGFFDELQEFSAKNPLFSSSDAPKPRVRRYNPETGKIE